MRLALITLILLCCAPARAQFGPPQTRAPALGWSLGVGDQNTTSEWRPYDYLVSRNRIYVEGSYGFTDNVEGFLRAGGADFVVNDVHTWRPNATRDVSSDGYPAFFSGGVRFRALQIGRWSLGGSLEAARYAAQERAIRWSYDIYQELHFDSTLEFNFGLSIGWRIGQQSTLYGGPLLHMAYTNVDVRTNEFGPDWEIEDTLEAITLRDKAGVGGFFGWSSPLGGSAWTVQLEGYALARGLGGAANVYCSF